MEIWETDDEKKLSLSDLKHKYYLLSRKLINKNPPVAVITIKTQKLNKRRFAYYYSAIEI